MNEKFLKPYNPADTEDRTYELWEKSGFFNPDNLPKRNQSGKPFSIVLPPPNVTGTLHMGHALMLSIEDIMVRYARMSGKKTLWLPGTDHAAIATQSKVEKELQKKEGKSRHDIGREELLKRVDVFAKQSHDAIVTQMRKMGCSIDWSREAFTLDEKRNLAVRTAFKKMYDDGLIYRGYRVINWDPKGQTTISDDSAIDWEIAQKNNLPLKQVINEFGKMIVGLDSIKGKKTAEAREAVVEWMKSEGLLEKEEEIEHNISLAERTGGVIEPLPKLQWFVAANKKFKIGESKIKGIKKGQEVTLKELMHAAVESGQTKMIPDRFEKVYFNWIDNLRDWCISRQIWYGHRIPVWYRGEAGSGMQEVYCDINPPANAHATGWIQDEDTLDTWFSSGLWTFSTLGWPDEKEFAKQRMYHPTTVLETGWDIIFFWVARMILMSTYILGEVPFETVYFHGIARNGKNEKISKSLGNNVEPLDMIAKYGADAVRMSLIVNVGPGNDSRVGEDKIKAYKLFANKLWNITRFILSSTEGVKYDPKFSKFTKADKALHGEFSDILKDVTSDMENSRYYLASDKLYQYAWHRLADIILEESKAIIGISFQDGKLVTKDVDSEAKLSRQQFLLNTLIKLVSALHPFMPYITEEIWPSLSTDNKELLMVSEWPNK